MAESDVESLVSDFDDGEGVTVVPTEAGTDVLDDYDDLNPDDFDMGTGSSGRALQLEGLEPAQQLTVWRDSLMPVEVDLISELDGSNLFIISIESVIFDMLSVREVAFESELQFLRLTQAIEVLLKNLRSSGGLFRLVFFDCMKPLFGAAFGEASWAFRQAFLLHCRVEKIDHVVFPHWYCTEWKEHVQQWRPS
eukprot:CAMPEP_0170629882 /NCGR_PEP_ID=MMETSP0224-20130122/33622_1 /TAXON_ID=285029 /ORGANISM="Togula jolla, Strain CCCM 725" /LENGTH=193 /DNA_ID=CAMNT_0010957739 /DNA_START=55 /DNA_END=633 /DNA_ORIENTATION=-